MLAPIGSAHLIAESNQAIGIGKGQRAQQNTIDDGEDSRRSSNTKRQHENSRCRKSRRLAQLPQNQLQIGKDSVHGIPRRNLSRYSKITIDVPRAEAAGYGFP